MSIAVTWAAVLIALIPNQEYASAYGNYIIRLVTILALGAGVVGVVVYLCWPSESAHQAENEGKRMMQRMDRVYDEMKADRLRDLGEAQAEREAKQVTGFVISTTQQLEGIRMREIRVRLPSGELVSREARFYTVSVGGSS